MKKNIFASLLMLLILSCDKKETPLSFENKQYNNTSLEACSEGICPEIKIEKLTAAGGGYLSDSINNAIENVLIANLIIDPDLQDEIKTLDEAIASFISNYRDYRDEFPDSAAGYEFTSTSSISFESEELLSIAFENYSFWGGAHGYGSTTFVNVNKETGANLNSNALFTNKAAFLKLAEQKFRKQQEIPEGENINSTGYFFQNDAFILPENIGFTNDELVLHYNPYEVASYAEGQLILKFPLSEIKEYLKPVL